MNPTTRDALQLIIKACEKRAVSRSAIIGFARTALHALSAQPAAPEEFEKALDDALGEAWRRGATGCHPAGEMVLRAHVLRLASAGVVATVSREALVAAYAELFNNDDSSALRALGIEVKE